MLTRVLTVPTSGKDHHANTVGKDTNPVAGLRLSLSNQMGKIWENIIVQISSESFILIKQKQNPHYIQDYIQ